MREVLDPRVPAANCVPTLDRPAGSEAWTPLEQALYYDRKSLLPDNNVMKSDRMGMAHGLEARAPLLDFRLMDWADRGGASSLLDGRPKSHLCRLLARRFGESFVSRPKGQFSVPFGDWMRGPLAPIVSVALDSLVRRGHFLRKPLRRLFGEHQSGAANHTRKLRLLFTLELWFDRFFEPGALAQSLAEYPVSTSKEA